MRRLLAPLLIAVILAGSAAAGPTPYARLYVFGDSYSDIGAGYIDGNGPTAVAYLAWLMGLNVAPATAKDAAARSLVFAVSGARTGESTGRHIKDALLGYGMANQVRDFVARVKSGEITFDPATTLFFMAGGLNDGRLPTEETVANIRSEIAALGAVGGRHFTVALLPAKIPQFSATGVRLNPAIRQLVEHDAATPALDVWLNHWGPAFDDVIEHPSQYGIVNTTSACAGRAIFDQDATPIGDPATFFFYHEGHPSTAVHRIVGRKLFEEVVARGAGAGISGGKRQSP